MEGSLFFRYLAARLRHRDPAAGRFLRQGLGIEKRARRLRKFWEPHLERSKAAQRRWIAEVAGVDLAVLGAGRLFDFAADTLPTRFERALLIDADPSCADHWGGLACQVEPRIGDLTGCAERWQRELDGLHGGWAETLEQIRQTPKPGDRAMPLAADAVLSLNVLSQLPIGWQDRVEDHLERRFGARAIKVKEDEWLAAVEPGGRWIVEQHLAALAASNARSILLITDVEYVEYRGGANSVRWESGVWSAGEGLRVDVSPALYGVELAIAGYTQRWEESWLWDISPIGAESREYGAMHRVAARAFDLLR